MKTIDLFSGCGGMTLGFKWAGFNSVLASDIDENCEKTFLANFPDVPFLCGDISIFEKKDFDVFLKNKEIDIAFIISSDSNPEIIDDDFFVLKLSNDLLCAIMSPKNPLSTNEKVNVSDLKNEKLILPTGTNTLQEIIKKYFESNNLPFKTTYCCDQTEAALAFASENLGVYFGTANIAHSHGHYELVCIPLSPTVYRSFSLVTADKLKYHPTLKNFVSFVKDNFPFRY